MRYAFCCLLVATVTITAISGENGKKSDLKHYQGSWQAVQIWGGDGKPVSKDKVRATTIDIKGNKFTLTTDINIIYGTFSLDEKKKTIDVTLNPSQPNKMTILGIYKIEKKKRRSCFALSGQPRPTEFVKKKGFATVVWERQKND